MTDLNTLVAQEWNWVDGIFGGSGLQPLFQGRKNSVDDFSRIALGDVQPVGDGQGQFFPGDVLLVHGFKN